MRILWWDIGFICILVIPQWKLKIRLGRFYFLYKTFSNAVSVGNQQRQNLLKPNKTENTNFINKIICLLKLINFLFKHLKLILITSTIK